MNQLKVLFGRGARALKAFFNMCWLSPSRIEAFFNWKYYLVVVAALVVFGHTLLALNAWHGSRASLMMLIVFLFIWTALSFLNGHAWRGTLKDWRATIAAWKESSALATDYSYLLVEAVEALSTYDREKSDDISARAITIGRMRTQNIGAKLNDRR